MHVRVSVRSRASAISTLVLLSIRSTRRCSPWSMVWVLLVVVVVVVEIRQVPAASMARVAELTPEPSAMGEGGQQSSDVCNPSRTDE